MAALSAEQRKLFEGKNFVAVATVGRDGTPRNTIVWVDMDGDNVLLNGTNSRGWVKSIKHNPKVALTIYDHEAPYSRVTVLGTAIEVTAQGGEESIDKLSMKYGGRPYPDHRAHDPRVIIRVRPDKVTSQGLG